MKHLLDGVKEVAGPFGTQEQAAEWLYREENYQPGYTTTRGLDGKWYVIDVSDERRETAKTVTG